jgi:tRNASer (uridine44-2'-O)-methyltransferase
LKFLSLQSRFILLISFQEETVRPDSVYEAEWVIGNHSDELTPWIPVIAFNSGPQTNFFILPCCPFDFRGKFGRNGSSETILGTVNCPRKGVDSTFSEYKNFVAEIGKVGKSEVGS